MSVPISPYRVRGYPRGRTHAILAGKYARNYISTSVCGRRFSAYEADRLEMPHLNVLSGVTTDHPVSCVACRRATEA